MAPDTLAGKRTKCPKCGAMLTIPASAPQPQAPNPHAAMPGPDLSDPLGLGDASQYERAGMQGGPFGAPGGYYPNPLQGNPLQAPGYGWQQPGAGYGWQQQPASRQGVQLSKGVIAAIVGGGLVLVLGLVGIIVAISLSGSDDSVAQADAGDSPAPQFEPQPDAGPSPMGNADGTPTNANDGASVPEPATGDPMPAGPMPPEPMEPATSTEPPEPAAPPPTFVAGIDAWRNSSGSLRGAIPIKDEELIVYHHSWQTQLLPYLGQDDLFQKFRLDQPWTKSPNLALAQTIVPQFLNPADGREKWEGYPFNGVALTHYVGMSGVEDKRNVVAAALPRSDVRAGVFGYGAIARPDEITDGLSQTLMIIGSGEMAGPWAQGGGATIRGAREPYFDGLTGFGTRGLSQRGALAVFADGSVREISAEVDPRVFRSMCTIHGADSIDQDRLGQPRDALPMK
jgi:hypothetical protein